MMRRWPATAALLLAGTLAGAQEAPAPVGPELLANGGFEDAGEPAAGWRPFTTRDWGECEGTARRSGERPHLGTACVEMSGVKVQFALVHAGRLRPEPGQAYLLTAWLRTELTSGESAFLAASWSSDERWLSLQSSAEVRGRTPWRKVELLLTPEGRPAAATQLQVSVRVRSSTARGRAWVDDVSLRACRVPPPPPGAALARRRLLDLARELLVQRQAWAGRLTVLQRRRADLQRLLDTGGTFDELVARWGDQVRTGRFLTEQHWPPAAMAAATPPDDQAVVAQVAQLSELPELRERCLAELEATLALKRQLDAKPELRRFYLWSQLSGERGTWPQPSAATPDPNVVQKLNLVPAQPDGGLVDLVARTRYDRAANVGRVTLELPEAPGDGRWEVAAGLVDAGGTVVACGESPLGDAAGSLLITLPAPHPWFPDAPYVYQLKAVLLHDGAATDVAERPVAFREIRLAETDVVPTLRHAWGWSLTDHTFLLNGQPYFPSGTVCGAADGHTLEMLDLFDELWLDFQRTYGTYLSRVGGETGAQFAARGKTFLAAQGPRYPDIRRYVSAELGLEGYREQAHSLRGLVDHPAVLSLEVGNEAELAVWGADLGSAYGDDLWQVFDEVVKALRLEADPAVPVSYTRAANFGRVLPVPRTDYSGVNQYTGRYWGRRATISPDLDMLSFAAAYDDKPIAITEWNGPKYSWATRGVSGVDENGAAQYVFDYFRTLRRAPSVVLDTEFVLNWIVTPLEDLTSVPLEEGLKQRASWSWSLQQGTPWYPRIWPDLLTDTPARRAMRGFESPVYNLVEAPGEVVVAADDRAVTGRLTEAIGKLRPGVRVAALPSADEFAKLDANIVLIGGLGDDQPAAVKRLEAMGIVGATTADWPGAGTFLIQRRVNPDFPDRCLIVVTAGDATGRAAAVDKLLLSAAGLEEALARQASCRRALALIDEGSRSTFERYVMELPTRGGFRGWDDVRTTLDPAELHNGERLREPWSDLGLVVVAVRRELTDAERTLLLGLPRQGVNVVWSAATLEADAALRQALGVRFGAGHSLTDKLPVADWAAKPLAVPELGDVAAERITQFTGRKPGDAEYDRGLRLRELHGDGWRSVAGNDGQPVVVMRDEGPGSQWLFGADLASAGGLLTSTTSRGKTHSIYDRDTACGLERLFRLVANAGAWRRAPRPADNLRLRAEVSTDRETYPPGATIHATVEVRDAMGTPCDATVRLGLAPAGRSNFPATPASWASAWKVAEGRYQADLPPIEAAPTSYRGQTLAGVFADVARSGWVGDWTSHVVRLGAAGDGPQRMAELARLVREGKVVAPLSVQDREGWIELEGDLELPAEVVAGRPMPLTLTIRTIENDTGNDYLEDTEVCLRRAADGKLVTLPVAPGKVLSAPDAKVVKDRPNDVIVVDGAHPARFELTWPAAEPGLWSVALAYRYTDEYHIADTNRVERSDPVAGMAFEVR